MRWALTLLCIVHLAACGGGDGPTSPVAPNPPTKPDPEPDPEPVPLVVSMKSELYQRTEDGWCDFDIFITATGDGEATWTGLGVVWHREGLGSLPDSRDAQWLTDWLEQPGVSAERPASGALLTLPDSLSMVLRFNTDAGKADSAAHTLRCPR